MYIVYKLLLCLHAINLNLFVKKSTKETDLNVTLFYNIDFEHFKEL